MTIYFFTNLRQYTFYKNVFLIINDSLYDILKGKFFYANKKKKYCQYDIRAKHLNQHRY